MDLQSNQCWISVRLSAKHYYFGKQYKFQNLVLLYIETKLGPCWKNAEARLQRHNPVGHPFYPVWSCLALHSWPRKRLTHWIRGTQTSLTSIPRGVPQRWAAICFEEKMGKFVFHFFFFFLQKFNSESEKLSYWNKYFPTKKVVFQQVSIFWCKQIYCGKIPNKLYFGVLQKKNVARENYWNGIYKGTHMILYRLQIKWQGSIWDKDLREFNLSFLGQWKSLIQETQPEINKQTNSVPTTTSHDFISL